MLQHVAQSNAEYIEIVDDGLHELDKKRVLALKEIARSRKLRFSVHAPFADMNIASPSKPMLRAILKRLGRSMNYANLLDANLWIFHPGAKTGISMFYPGEDWTQNSKSLFKIFKTAKNYGLNIAIENLPEKYGFIMKSPRDFLRFYKESGLNGVGIALDVGHASLEGYTENFLRRLPDKIWHIHVSDNEGEHDQHLGIGYGRIDWKQFAKILHEIDYDKTIMVESTERVDESLKKLQQLLN
jgi:sugar phosphate isomerase/epimerase